MSSIKNFIFCGGGSGGHVIPAITLYRYIKQIEPNARYISIGGYDGIEKDLFSKEGLDYFAISTGKLRRYFSWDNFFDILKIIKGIIQSFLLLLKWNHRDSVVLATGGFVTVPVVFSAWLQRKRIIVHEQTTRVGLANKICSIFANEVIVTFEESLRFFPAGKAKHLGYPLRKEIFEEDVELKFIKDIEVSSIDRPIMFITGGGNGSKLLNDAVDEVFESLRDDYFIIHQCGKKYEEEYLLKESPYYKVFGFVGIEIIDFMKKANVIISRSGAGTVVELVALGKPSVFIPLRIAQKNEQYHNAMSAHDKLGSIVIEECELTAKVILKAIEDIQKLDKKSGVKNNPTEDIVNLILNQ